MSPAPRKKKGEEAPTAAEVEEQVSQEAGKSVPRADEEASAEASASGDERSEAVPAAEVEAAAEEPKAPAKKPRAKKAEESAAGEPAAEEKPKRSRKKAEPEADEKPAKPARKRDQPRATRQPGEPAVLVSAKARYVRTSARKARLVCDHIRGKDVEQARAILSFTPRGAAKPWLKLLESAIANAEHNHELVGDELKIASIHADEGPTLKRYRPRAMGRATRIRKRTSHLTITLTPKE
jgi:ribosomal protein L22